MRINLLTLLLISLSVFSFAQKKPVATPNKPVFNNNPRPISPDCSKPIKINVTTESYYGQTFAPNGFGEEQEFKTNNSLTFEGEHNSAWYLLSMSRDGELIFEIVPKDTANDYDFLLYAYTDSTFCDALQKNKLKPLRSNLSNVKKSAKGVTGLNSKTKKNAIGEGVGFAFSSPIDVKKDEKYILVLDNVTPEGKGHTIYFYFLKDVEIKGKIIGVDSIPLIAEITLSDNKGNTIEETTSNINGEYKINTEIKENQNYSLTYLSEETFVQSTTINTKSLKGATVFLDIKTVLPKLKKGEKYRLGNINFYGNSATLLPESISSVESLYKLMKKNKKMIIQIHGHTNGEDWHLAPKNQHPEEKILSENRAKNIYDYLISKGINQDRISTSGFSSTKPLFETPKNEFEQSANRRVEIKVLSIE